MCLTLSVEGILRESLEAGVHKVQLMYKCCRGFAKSCHNDCWMVLSWAQNNVVALWRLTHVAMYLKTPCPALAPGHPPAGPGGHLRQAR